VVLKKCTFTHHSSSLQTAVGSRVMPCVSEKWADLTEKLIESFITASILRSRKLLLRQSERLSKQAALLLGIAIWPRFGSIKGRDCVSEQTRL
jgi:hypothetical protein